MLTQSEQTRFDELTEKIKQIRYFKLNDEEKGEYQNLKAKMDEPDTGVPPDGEPASSTAKPEEAPTVPAEPVVPKEELPKESKAKKEPKPKKEKVVKRDIYGFPIKPEEEPTGSLYPIPKK